MTHAEFNAHVVDLASEGETIVAINSHYQIVITFDNKLFRAYMGGCEYNVRSPGNRFNGSTTRAIQIAEDFLADTLEALLSEETA